MASGTAGVARSRSGTVPPPGWQTVLDGELAARARRRVADAGQALLAEPRPGRDDDPSLGSGSVGLAITHQYLAAATGDPAHRRRATRHLAHAERVVRSGRVSPTLYGGFVGLAWAVEHLGASTAGDGLDRLETVDQTLVRSLGHHRWPWHFDLISGLVGIGFYALERLPRPGATRLCELVVEQLGSWAEPRTEGVAWHTPSRLMIPDTASRFPDGHDNLGLAHGAPGVVSFLGGCCAADVAQSRVRPLLDAAVAWVLGERLSTPGARFPVWRAPGDIPRPARAAWCYGDPGVASALLIAGIGAGRPDWSQLAVELAVDAAGRPLDRSGVVDASLCHGAAGLAHLFNRMYQLSGDPALADAARVWFGHAVEMPHPDHGDEFLMGRPGVALALLAAVEPADPGWDRVLALSTRSLVGDDG